MAPPAEEDDESPPDMAGYRPDTDTRRYRGVEEGEEEPSLQRADPQRSGVQAGVSQWEAERNEGLESRSTSVNIWSALHHSRTRHTSPRSHPH
ncbi:hypothetical protein EYF80_054572 [Liparis tanakae]|uniref:Uncharacterized protein n=1 Tax=Liparis tanakae TaxID=230148 RepID=A0A4Z2F446_9TELE|nr:hypothetical protein EYF80_054572 [Liparis tanakae]